MRTLARRMTYTLVLERLAMRAIVSLVLAVCLVCLAWAPAFAAAQPVDTRVPVRVGMVEQQGYSMRNDQGVPTGFDAEYVAYIAQEGGLDIEYAYYDDFDSLLNALEAGDIDMTAGISKTADREERFLFSDGALDSGYLTVRVRADDDRYEYGDAEQLASMQIGIIRGSSMGGKALAWAEGEGIELHLVDCDTESAMFEALDRGDIDAYISQSGGMLPSHRDIFQLSTDEYFMAINRERPDIKALVDKAMRQIGFSDPNFVKRLRSRWTTVSGQPVALTAEQKAYLSSIGRPLKVAVVENDAPHYYMTNGVEQGIVPDYYNLISEVLAEMGLDVSFEYVAYATQEETGQAVASGEADILGVTGMDSIEAMARGLALSAPYSNQSIMGVALNSVDMHSIVDLAMSGSSASEFETPQRVAVLTRDLDELAPYLDGDGFALTPVPYETLDECYQAVLQGDCSLVVLCSPHASWLVNQHRSGLFAMFTIVEDGWSIRGATAASNTLLASALSQVAVAERAEMSAIIAQNIAPRTDFFTILQRLPLQWLVLGFSIVLVAALALVFVIMRALRLRAKRRHDLELIKAQSDLLHAYEYDALTGLPNRTTAIRDGEETLSRSDSFSVILLAVDNVDLINESYGHEQGDTVLLEMASRAKQWCAQDKDRRMIARFGGNVFSVLALEADAARARELADELFALTRMPISLGEESCVVAPGSPMPSHCSIDRPGYMTVWMQARIGIASSDGKSGPEEVFQHAEIALEKARENTSDVIAAYAEELNALLARHNEVQAAVASAIDSGGFYIVYQPQVSLKDMRVAGFEALVRLRGSDMSPAEFIPVAEESGLVSQIGRITTELVIQQIAAWRDAGATLVPVSINFSNMQLGDAGYLDFLDDLLHRYGVPASLVEIEITEGFLFQRGAEADELFAHLRDAGIRVLIDDFGSGYSSLQYLSDIPADVVKLDKSLVDSFLVRDGENAFIRDVVRLIHSLGKQIIAEGIEEKWQVDELRACECDMVQGFFFARPLSADNAASFCL